MVVLVEIIKYLLLADFIIFLISLIYLLFVGFEFSIERKDKLSDIIITFKINNYRKQLNRLKESWKNYKKMRDELY